MRLRLDPNDFMYEAYFREYYMKAYSHIVHPIPGPKQWETTTYPQPTPPPFRIMPGRSSLKKRKKDVNEITNKNVVKMKRMRNACSNCGMLGHNIKKCKNPGVARRTNNKRQNQVIYPLGSEFESDIVQNNHTN